jgi:hypothetical protein
MVASNKSATTTSPLLIWEDTLLVAPAKPGYTLANIHADRYSNVVLQFVRPWVCPLTKIFMRNCDQELGLPILIVHTRSCWMNIAPPAIDKGMPTRGLSRVAEPTLHRESLYLPLSLKQIPEVEEEEEDNETSTTMELPNQQLGPNRAPRAQRYVWFCCQCGDGPSAVKYVSICTECNHPRCGACTVATTKA